MSGKFHSLVNKLDFIGIILFFAVYFIAPKEYSVRYAAITLLVVTLLQIIVYYAMKVKIPKKSLAINILALIFTIPTIVYNDLAYLRIKLVVVKFLFFAIPLIMLIFKKNCIYLLIGNIQEETKYITNKEWNIINNFFIINSFIAFIVSIIGAHYLSDNDFVIFKTFFLTIISLIYIIPLFYYSIKAFKRFQQGQAEL